MKSLGLMKDLLLTYVALSGEGTRFIRKLKRTMKGQESTGLKQFLFGKGQRATTLRTLRICDKCFSENVDEETCDRVQRARSAVYGRMIPFAWGNLGLHCRILDAMGIPHDADTEARSVIVSFVHREWNDLMDEHGFTFKDIYVAAETDEQIPDQLVLLRKLRRRMKQMAPAERFPDLYRHLTNYRRLAPVTVRDSVETAERMVSEVASFVAMAHAYIMLEHVPQKLIDVLGPASKWFAYLDEITDIDRDKASGRITFMSRAQNPEKEVRTQCKECIDTFRRLSPHPESMVEFIEATTRAVISRQGKVTSIEERLATAS